MNTENDNLISHETLQDDNISASGYKLFDQGNVFYLFF